MAARASGAGWGGHRSPDMLDIAYLIGGCVFFALAVLYTVACDHL
jgi:hypothetical protein